MYRSSDLTDEASRLKQFAWEQWENHPFVVLFRPGTYGLDRYVVKRYIEQVLSQTDRWKQLSSYFSDISPPIRTYSITAIEAELMQRILDFHLNDNLHMRVTVANDQLIEYDELIEFLRRVQEFSRSNPNILNNNRSISNKKTIAPVIPAIHSSYVLPPSAKSMLPPLPAVTPAKISPVKPVQSKPMVPSMPMSQASVMPTPINKYQTHSATSNGYRPAMETSSRLPTNVPAKSNTISSSTMPCSSSSSSSTSIPSLLPDLNPSNLNSARIDGSGWVQINNVFLPFILKNRQRLIPYQVLVSCKILEPDELRLTLTRATTADTILMNRMIRDCKINNEEIGENAPLINVYHVLIGTKNFIYMKILPKDSPTSKINRQYKSVLALRGGTLYITNRKIPFVCSSNHSYIPLADVLSIYHHLDSQLRPLARVPRTHELDYLQLVQVYHDEKELPSDTLLIDMEDLNQRQIIPSKNTTLVEYRDREKTRLDQQIAQLNQQSGQKRKNTDGHDQPSSTQKFKPSTSSSNLPTTANAFVRPPTGYYPGSSGPSSSSSLSSSSSSSYPSQYQTNQWMSSNQAARGRTR